MNTNNTYQQQQNRELPQNHGGYGATLLDPRWKNRRQAVMQRDNNKCVNCGSIENLQVHHRQYHFSKSLNEFRYPWDYNDKYLITLCEHCHQKGHRSYRVPVKMVN